MYHDTVTLFNRVKNRGGDTWYPKILRGVNLNTDKGAVVKAYGPEAQDNVIMNIRYKDTGSGRRIPSAEWMYPGFDDLDGGLFSGWKEESSADGGTFKPLDNLSVERSLIWLPPKQWQRLEDHARKLTFASGSAFDFFWCGEWTGGDVVYDDNYGDMSFYDYMLQNYDYVYAITSVSEFSVIPHFEVLGK